MKVKKNDPRNDRDDQGRFLPANTAGLKSGVYSYRVSGKIPSVRGKRRIEKDVKEVRAGLIKDVPDSHDTRKQLLIEQICQTEIFKALIFEYLKTAGLLRPDKWRRAVAELQPIALEIVKLMNCQRAALVALGLDVKRADDVLDLGKYIEQRDAEKNTIAEKESGGKDEKSTTLDAKTGPDNQAEVDPGAPGAQIQAREEAGEKE